MSEDISHEMTEEEIEALEQEYKEQIEAWKKEYFAIYRTTIQDVEFIWRGLSRMEFKHAIELYEDEYDRAEYVCRLCILNPIVDDYSVNIYAGVPEVLAGQILVESGFTEDGTKLNTLMQEHEAEMNSFENQVSCIIKEFFNEYTLEEIEGWTLEKTMWYYSRAMWSLRVLRGINLEQEDGEDGGQAFPQLPPEAMGK